MFNVLAAGFVLAASLVSPFAQATTPEVVTPPSQKITIDLISMNGSGCAPGTTALAINEDNTAFTVTYSNYMAMVGVGAKATDFRKNCQMNIRVNVPSGFSYAIIQSDYRGFAQIQPGAIASERANYYFAGLSPTVYAEHKIPGAFDDNWHFTDTAELTGLSWSPCGEKRNLNINTELKILAGTSNTTTKTSVMAMDSHDGTINTKYHFAWQQCPA